jgi:ferrous-iron efflux pump FieF
MTADTHPSKQASRLMRGATYAAVATALVLIAAKLAAWAMTGSVAMLSSLIDSVLDAGASIINLVAVHHALTPADSEHRFGHGKAEALAGLGQASFITGSVGFLLVEAIGRLSHPVPVQRIPVGIAVMAASILVTFALVRFQKYVVEKTRSVAVGADALHYTGDLLINGSVIASLLLERLLGWTFIDSVAALIIAIFLLKSAWGVALTSLDMLMDRELPTEDRRRIRDIARSHPQVRNVHDLRTRNAGSRGFIQLHLELDADMPLRQAHAIADEVEVAINAAFPTFEVMIHQDPAGLREAHPRFDPSTGAGPGS